MDANYHSLTLGLISGNKQSYLTLYKLFYRDLCSYACKFVRNLQVAEDVVQETFLKLWKTRENLDPDLKLSAYLYKSVRNNSIDFIRAEYKLKQFKEYLLNRKELSSTENELFMYENELYTQLSEAVNSIPGKSKEVFKLSRYRGLKHKEIARLMNITVKGVEYHINRALKCVIKKVNRYSEAV